VLLNGSCGRPAARSIVWSAVARLGELARVTIVRSISVSHAHDHGPTYTVYMEHACRCKLLFLRPDPFRAERARVAKTQRTDVRRHYHAVAFFFNGRRITKRLPNPCLPTQSPAPVHVIPNVSSLIFRLDFMRPGPLSSSLKMSTRMSLL
jgi:hypothetical protein